MHEQLERLERQTRVTTLRVLLVTVAALLASSCSVAVDDLDVTIAGQGRTSPTQVDAAVGLPALGPIPASSHWHAAYVVRVCDDVLPPFESTDDPLGIHSHGDGVMHVHPFFEASGYESATLSLFADAMGFALSDGELTLPGGGTWRDGDLCDGVPGRVFVDRWQSPNPDSQVERIFEGLDALRYQADGELYQIAFAPADSFPVVPPAAVLLPELSNLGPVPEPWVDIAPVTGDELVSIWDIGSVDADPCTGSAVPERVLFGPVRCFVPDGAKLTGAAVVGDGAGPVARAVMFNRQPAVELQMTAELRRLINDHFATSDNPIALALEVDGFVVSAPQLVRPPVSDRLVLVGGFTVDTAERLVELFNR